MDLSDLNLCQKDSEFIINLKESNTHYGYNSIDNDYKYIYSLFNNSDNTDYVRNLKLVFDKINNKEELVFSNLKFFIVDKIINKFINLYNLNLKKSNEMIKKYFDKYFFDEKIINFLIKNKIFYKDDNSNSNIIDLILSDNELFEYFNFYYNENHQIEYEKISRIILKKFNLNMNADYYFRISNSKILIPYNYIIFIDRNLSNENYLKHINLGLLICIITSLNELLNSEKRSLTLYQGVNNNIYGDKFIEKCKKDSIEKCNFYSDILKKILNLNLSQLILNKLSNLKLEIGEYHLTYEIKKKWPNEEIDKFTIYSDECLILINILNNFYSEDKKISKMLDSIMGFKKNTEVELIEMGLDISNNKRYWNKHFSKKLYLYLKNKDVNINFKLKFIGNFLINKTKYLNNPIILRLLLKFYTDSHKIIENDNYTTYQKNLVQIKILNYLESNFNEKFFNTNLDDEFNYVENNKSIFNDFFILMISDINYSLSKLSQAYSLFKSEKNFSKNILNYSFKITKAFQVIFTTYKYLSRIIKIKNFTKFETFNYKLLEMFSNFISIFIKNNIYNSLNMIKNNIFIKNFLSDSYSDKLYYLINQVFSDLNFILKNKNLKIKIINSELFQEKDILKTVLLFGKIPIKTNDDEISLENILNYLLSIITENKITDIKYKSEIPNEFIDPILLVEISDPVELPETKNILNKNTIFNHLIFYQTNPFSGSELNKEKLIEYNKLPEVKDRCLKILGKINEWKEKNKM
tara:strand:+ start:2483 stop:4735 length:2253 start_codon:yes stop_codon:yes gene_type:complete